MKIVSICIIAGLFFSACCNKKAELDATVFVNSRVVPKVKSVESIVDCGFKLGSIKSIVSDEALNKQAEYLSGILSSSLGKQIPVKNNGKLVLAVNGTLNKEAYTLEIGKTGVRIEGGSASGVYYGIQTFLQLLPVGVFSGEIISEEYVLPPMLVDDEPRLKYRGMMVDVSRHFIPFNDLLEYVELLGQHKFNVLHLHLTDDQGWRLEIKSHPELTEIGAVRGTGKVLKPFRHRRAPEWQQNDPDPYGPFYYTQDQIRQLIDFAAVRGVTIIPEIDVPGHSLAVNKSLDTGCKVKGLEGVHGYKGNVLCAGNERVFEILDDIFAEVAALFPSEYIHIGGDEVNRKQWLNCPKCKKLMKEKQFSKDAEIQHYFVKRTYDIVTKYGKKPIGWNEILKGGELPEGTTIMSWIGPKPGIEAAKKGIDVIMAPGKHCYFDMKEADHYLEPGHWWAGIVSVEKVYQFDPYESIPQENQKYIKGITAALWSEYVIPEKEQLHFKSFPRLCAMAEVGWSQAEARDYEDFMERMGAYQLPRLDAQGVGYRVPRATYEVVQDSIVINAPYKEAEIRYTINGEEPTVESELYTKPLSAEYIEGLKFITLSPAGRACKYADVIKKEENKK